MNGFCNVCERLDRRKEQARLLFSLGDILLTIHRTNQHLCVKVSRYT